MNFSDNEFADGYHLRGWDLPPEFPNVPTGGQAMSGEEPEVEPFSLPGLVSLGPPDAAAFQRLVRTRDFLGHPDDDEGEGDEGGDQA